MPRMHKSKIEIKDRECKASFDRNKKGMSFGMKDGKALKQLEKSRYKIGESCIICNTQ